LFALLLLAAALAACSPSAPEESPARRAWRGPSPLVSSEGLTTYERREIAQRVTFPTCIFVGATSYRFAEVETLPTGAPVPVGLLDTGYGLGRWRLLARAGLLEEQEQIYVSVRGSTGILGRYDRLSAADQCFPHQLSHRTSHHP
jgi:hypothetical protein